MVPLSMRMLRRSGEHDVWREPLPADVPAPFELRDVTRGLQTALLRAGYRHPLLDTALARYVARARRVGRQRDEVAQVVTQLVREYGLREVPERERQRLLALVVEDALALYDRPA